jgi:BON domain
MTLRSRYFIAALAGLCMTLAARSQEPGRLQLETAAPSSENPVNQRTADSIAERLRQSGLLRNYRVDIAFQGGTAVLSGTVADQNQRDQVIRTAQSTSGVEHVVDHLGLSEQGAVTRVQAPEQTPLPAPALVPTPHKENGPENNADPVPSGPMGPASAFDPNAPKMPPYSWPTYAPYNNYSRVAYPEAYPYNSWPFIGPVYPFPKIPLGWRSVKLEWQDGHWWFSKVATKHDWWRLRYW